MPKKSKEIKNSQFRNLVFEGGGVKGIAYAGAVQVLEQRGVMPGIIRVAGTSAGAIVAVLLALRCKSKRLEKILAETDFNSFKDAPWFFAKIRNFVRKYGLYKGDAFGLWMKERIAELADDGDLKFGELQGRGFLDLRLIGTDLTRMDIQEYSAEKTPDMKIWEATRTSMSIPFFFYAIKRDEGVLVDGGVSYNYPIDIFDDSTLIENKKAGIDLGLKTNYDRNHIYNAETLGFRVDTIDEIEAEKTNWGLPRKKISNIKDFAGALMTFMMDMANKLHLHGNDWHRTVFIDAKGVGTTDFDIKPSQMTMLVKSGRKSANLYFDWFTKSKYKAGDRPFNKI